MSDPSVMNSSQAEQLSSTDAEFPWLRHYEQGVPAHIDIPDRPLTWILDQTVSRFPSQTAFIYYGNRLSYARFSSLANRFAAALLRLGIKKGDRVAIALPNIPQYPIAFYGALRAGAVVVPTNPLYTEREMQHQLADSGARVIVMLDMFYPVGTRRARQYSPGTYHTHQSRRFPAPAFAHALPAQPAQRQTPGTAPDGEERREDATLHTMNEYVGIAHKRRHRGLQPASSAPLAMILPCCNIPAAQLVSRKVPCSHIATCWRTPCRRATGTSRRVMPGRSRLCVAPFFHVVWHDGRHEPVHPGGCHDGFAAAVQSAKRS